MAVINRDTDYAVRVLARLAAEDQVTPVSVLAEQEGVPVDFLRKIMQKLHRAGVVESVQGPFGGYRLAQSPGDVSLLHVLEVVQGPVAVNQCFGEPGVCASAGGCPLRRLLAGVQEELERGLAGITLAGISQCIEATEGVAE